MEKSDSRENGKEGLVDTLGTITYSLLAGAISDYASGLRGSGIAGARAIGTIANALTGNLYGKWRNFVYENAKTTDKSSRGRKYISELAAFNTFQVPLYAAVVCAGSLIENLFNGEIKVDWDKALKGAGLLAVTSPLIAPTMGLWMEGTRKIFNLKSAPRKAREILEDESEEF